MPVSVPVVLMRRWLCGAMPLVACLICAIPTPVEAHTLLLRSDPVNQAVLRSAPVLVRLWFSAAVDPAFSTGIVENAAHTYVNDRDAQLAPGDAREMEIHLYPHLPPGVYAVVWRAVSDGDGRILSGVVLFAIARPDGTMPGQLAPDDLLLSRLLSGQFDALTPFSLILTALVILEIVCWIGVSLWLLPIRQPGRTDGAEPGSANQQDRYRFARRLAFARKKQLRRLRGMLGWGSLVGVGVVISLGLGQGVEGSHLATSTSPPPALRLQQSGMGLLSAFHATLLTTDKRYLLVLDVNTDAAGLSVFTVSVEDAVTGKPIVDVDVSLLTTMLDMPMGTDTVNMHVEGKGRFSAQSDLSMGGLWQIDIQLHTSDHRLHEATVKMLTPS